MNQLESYIQHLNNDVSGHAEQFKKIADCNMLFVHPNVTGNDFYRMILPAMALNELDQVAAAFTSIIPKYNPVNRFRKYDIPLSSREILWSHTMVFPFISVSLANLFGRIRTMNKNIKIVYHVDFNFLSLDPWHPYYEIFTPSVKDTVLQNMHAANVVVAGNNRLADFFQQYNQKNRFILGKITTMPILFDENFMLEGVSRSNTMPEKFTLLVIVNNNELADLQTCTPELKAAKEKHGENLQLIIFGAYNNADFKSVMSGIEFTFEPAVPFTKYFQKLTDINPHLVMIPADASKFTETSHDIKRFIECSMLSIPVIAKRSAALNGIISNGNGFIYDTPEEFEKIIDEQIANPVNLHTTGASAYHYIHQHYTYTDDNLQKIINVLG